MAQPSSSHHGERHHRSERERERERHHHSRTISSTTLLLVLSLVLAVLAVMLSLPATSAGSDTASGVMGILTPKRTQALIARESAVAVREAEVARREAELLAGAPGGVIAQPPAASPSPVLCPVCTPTMVTETISLPAQTIIKEIVKEDSLAPAGWSGPRTEELIERELKIAERERDISKREENVNRREHDAARRESWIMEHLISLGNDVPQTVEEEYIYEQPPKRKVKPAIRDLPFASEYEPKTVIQTQTVTMHPPANTRLAASPVPNVVSPSTTPSTPRTTAVEEVEDRPRPVVRAPKRQPTRWFGAW